MPDIDSTATIVPGHGAVFTADRGVPLPDNPLTAFSLTGDAPAGWENVGHTSKSNTASFSKDGGDRTTLDSWLADNIKAIYAKVAWGLGVNPLQITQRNLDLAFGGHLADDGGYVVPSAVKAQEKQLFLLAQDGTGKLGFFIENSSVTLGDAPSIDTENFFELPLTAAILAADPEVIEPHPDGTPGIMKIYKSGLTVSAPRITGVTPASAQPGALISISGAGFTGATGAGGVKFGDTNAGAANYTVVSDTRISAIVPAGATGSKPITVTNPAGTSPAAAFTVN